MPVDSVRLRCLALAVLAALCGPTVMPTAAQSPQDHGAASGAGAGAGAGTAPPAAAASAAQASPDAALVAAQLPTYPLGACIACGKIWGAQDVPVDLVRKGRLIRVCNAECVKAFDVQATKWLKVLDDAIIAAQAGSYPLTDCPVTDEALSGKPKYVVVGTRLIEVCCGDCRKQMLTDADAAAAVLAKIDAALVKTQGEHYPLTTCVVDDTPLGDAPVQTLYGVTVVRFCGEACETKFKAGAREYIAKLDAARRMSGKPAPKADAPR